jgi:hypothetical protein
MVWTDLLLVLLLGSSVHLLHLFECEAKEEAITGERLVFVDSFADRTDAKGVVTATSYGCRNVFLVMKKENECIAVFLSDGYVHMCAAPARPYNITTTTYDHLTVITYSPLTEVIREITYYECSMEDRRLLESQEVSASSGDLTEPRLELGVLWPKDYATITTRDLDVHFYAATHHFDPARTANDVVCFELDKKPEKDAIGDGQQYWYACGSKSTVKVLTFPNISSGDYVLRGWVVGSDQPTSSEAFVDDVRNLIESEPGNRDRAAISVTFSVKNAVTALSQSNVESNTSGSGSPAASDPNWSKAAVFRLPTFVGDLHPDTSGNIVENTVSVVDRILRDDTEAKTAHVLLMSVRSLDRYQEAEIMMKSLFFNRQHLASRKGRLLVLHIVTDSEGQEFFNQIWTKYRLHRLHDLLPVFHDYNSVCVRNIESFLRRNDLNMSSHHSGVAGYCRIGIPMYFNQLLDILTADHDSNIVSSILSEELLQSSVGRHHYVALPPTIWKSLLVPKTVICLETDQLILTDIVDLWDYVEEHKDSNDFIAAPENYMPWDQPHSIAARDDYGRTTALG